jgi:hypothetical protein
VRSDTAKWGPSRVVPPRPEVRSALTEQIDAPGVGPSQPRWTRIPWSIRKTLASAGKRVGLAPFCVHDPRSDVCDQRVLRARRSG